MTGGGIARYLSLITYHASLVIVFALYARCVIFSFIGLDDAAYTFRNPFVSGGLSLPNVVEAFTNLRHGGIWMPVTYISYMLDVSICRWTGLPLMGEMHFVNVLLHVVNFMLFWKLLGKLFGASAQEGTRWANGTTETTGTDGTHGAADIRDPAIAGTADRRHPTIAVTAESRQFGARNQFATRNSQLSTLIAALAAMIWAVHPLRAEPVAWIAARKELLWTLFTLSGLIFWIRGMRDAGKVGEWVSEGVKDETRNTEHGAQNPQLPTPNYQLPTILCCALACLSKPTAMCFPFLLLLVTWWLRKEGKVGEWRSVSVRDAGRVGEWVSEGVRDETRNTEHGTQNPQLSTLNSQLIVLFLIAAITAAIAAYSQTHVAGQDAVALYAAPFVHRLVNALSAIGYYLHATFWPFGLHVDCRAVSGFWPLDAGWNFAALALAVTAALAMIAVANRRHPAPQPSTLNPEPSTSTRSTRSTRLKKLSTPNSQLPTTIIFSALWFLISLLPTLGLFGSFGMEAHADRFAYLPSMAFSFLLVGFWTRRGTGGTIDVRQPTSGAAIGNRDDEGGRVGARPIHNCHLPTAICQLLTVIVIALLSVVTFRQLSYWRDDWSAHQRVLDCDPGHPRALVHLADARCARQHDFNGGIRLYRKALELAGTVPVGGFNVADVQARLAYALASRGMKDDFEEVKRLGAAVLQDFRLDRRGMMLDALGTAFMAEGDSKLAARLFKASIEAPDRFWPKNSTRRKLESCR